jgi:hypothetical protein
MKALLQSHVYYLASNLLFMSVPGEVYSRNASISGFLLHFFLSFMSICFIKDWKTNNIHVIVKGPSYTWGTITLIWLIFILHRNCTFQYIYKTIRGWHLWRLIVHQQSYRPRDIPQNVGIDFYCAFSSYSW